MHGHAPIPTAPMPTIEWRRRSWTLRCEVCERQLTVRGVESPAAAGVLARINGWSVHEHSVRCPGCVALPPGVGGCR